MRKAGVRGTFYPQSCKEIESYIDSYNSTLKKADIKDDS